MFWNFPTFILSAGVAIFVLLISPNLSVLQSEKTPSQLEPIRDQLPAKSSNRRPENKAEITEESHLMLHFTDHRVQQLSNVFPRLFSPGKNFPHFSQCAKLFAYTYSQVHTQSHDWKHKAEFLNGKSLDGWDKKKVQTRKGHTYLAWRLTMITKVVPLGWDLSIALRFGWPLRLPQMWVTRTRNFW